jgi:hypothetical protein
VASTFRGMRRPASKTAGGAAPLGVEAELRLIFLTPIFPCTICTSRCEQHNLAGTWGEVVPPCCCLLLASAAQQDWRSKPLVTIVCVLFAGPCPLETGHGRSCRRKIGSRLDSQARWRVRYGKIVSFQRQTESPSRMEESRNEVDAVWQMFQLKSCSKVDHLFELRVVDNVWFDISVTADTSPSHIFGRLPDARGLPGRWGKLSVGLDVAE